jgi:hypothetical protein
MIVPKRKLLQTKNNIQTFVLLDLGNLAILVDLGPIRLIRKKKTINWR